MVKSLQPAVAVESLQVEQVPDDAAAMPHDAHAASTLGEAPVTFSLNVAESIASWEATETSGSTPPNASAGVNDNTRAMLEAPSGFSATPTPDFMPSLRDPHAQQDPPSFAERILAKEQQSRSHSRRVGAFPGTVTGAFSQVNPLNLRAPPFSRQVNAAVAAEGATTAAAVAPYSKPQYTPFRDRVVGDFISVIGSAPVVTAPGTEEQKASPASERQGIVTRALAPLIATRAHALISAANAFKRSRAALRTPLNGAARLAAAAVNDAQPTVAPGVASPTPETTPVLAADAPASTPSSTQDGIAPVAVVKTALVGQLPVNEWLEKRSKTTGALYWTNAQTGEVTPQNPLARLAEVPPKTWVQKISKTSGLAYYVSSRGEVSLTDPAIGGAIATPQT